MQLSKTKLMQQEEEHNLIVLRAEQASLKNELITNKTILDQQLSSLSTAQQEYTSLSSSLNKITNEYNSKMQDFSTLKETYLQTKEEYEKNYQKEQKKWIDEQTQEYLIVQKDFTEQFKKQNAIQINAAKELETLLSSLKAKVDAATKLEKDKEIQADYITYHSLQLSEEDINDIQQIEAAIIKVNQKAALAVHKAIWSVYYEKPYNDLINRVFKNINITHTGIYKITNTHNNKCYVGQAVDIAARWKQHIKRAIGAEERTNNKLYPAMYKNGVQNFSFEVIEECSREKLNEQEDYWQNFYNAKEYGYSIK